MPAFATCSRFLLPATATLQGASLSGSGYALSLVAEGPAVYRPRHPERSTFYRILDQHFDRYVAVHEERFEPKSGPLRSVVRPVVEAFLDCGRPKNGFARLRCPSCAAEHLIAFSCGSRNFCPSCQAKRSALFAEKLREKILAPVGHRHLVFTIPKALRGLFERDRSLLGLLARCAYEAVKTCFQKILGRTDAVPGFLASLQTFGSFSNFHPHLHALATDGLLAPGGKFVPLPDLDTSVLTEVFRRLVLDRLHEANRLSDRFRESLLSWVHPGFSVFAGPAISPDDKDRLERMARYVTRPPLAIGSVSLTPDGQVLIRTPTDPRTGEESKLLDPLEWVHSITSQIPDARQHLTRAYGAYANRNQKRYRATDVAGIAPSPARVPIEDADDAFTKTKKRNWARLLRKILEVDPMVCLRCGVEMTIIAVITDPLVVDKILAHLGSGRGHDPFEPRAPPVAKTG